MKSLRVIIMAVLLLPTGIFTIEAAAQVQSQEEIERERRMQEEFELQKKALIDKIRAQEEYHRMMMEQQIEIEKATREARDKFENSETFRDKPGEPKFQENKPFPGFEFFMPAPNVDRFSGRPVMGDNERVAWDFFRTMKETTFSKEYSFDVEQTAKNVAMAVLGDCKAGEIKIKVMMPSGKVFSYILIDELGNINWKKTFAISEEENQDKVGEWRFLVSASKATGYFKISLLTY